MSKEAPRPEEPFGFSEREQLFDRVSRQRFRAIFDDEATDVHRVELAHNSFGEFLFITTSRALGPGRQPVTFYGLGYHEQRERWLVSEWFFYHANPHPSTTARAIAKKPRFFIDTTGTYIGNTAYCLGTNDLYLLGILNSRLCWFAVSNISIPFGIRAGEYRYRMIYQYMESLPIYAIKFDNPADAEKHDHLVEMVEQMLMRTQEYANAEAMLEDRRHDLSREISRLDTQIDQLVYALYGLTEDEIALVEASS